MLPILNELMDIALVGMFSYNAACADNVVAMSIQFGFAALFGVCAILNSFKVEPFRSFGKKAEKKETKKVIPNPPGL